MLINYYGAAQVSEVAPNGRSIYSWNSGGGGNNMIHSSACFGTTYAFSSDFTTVMWYYTQSTCTTCGLAAMGVNTQDTANSAWMQCVTNRFDFVRGNGHYYCVPMDCTMCEFQWYMMVQARCGSPNTECAYSFDTSNHIESKDVTCDYWTFGGCYGTILDISSKTSTIATYKCMLTEADACCLWQDGYGYAYADLPTSMCTCLVAWWDAECCGCSCYADKHNGLLMCKNGSINESTW